MTTTATESLAVATCHDCGQSFHYEPIVINGRDFARHLNLRCETCDARASREAAAAERRDRAARIEADIVDQIPCDLRDTDLRHPDFNAPLWSAVARWRPTDLAYWLALVGPAGRCKTRCMAMLAMRAMRAGTRVAWTSAVRLHDAARDRSSRERTIAALARDHLQDCLIAPWLFLDDLGKNEWSPAFESQLFQLLDHRKNHRLPVIYSANVHPEGLALLISDPNREPIIGRLTDRTTLLVTSRD
jgi:DNA replication protein DnaC